MGQEYPQWFGLQSRSLLRRLARPLNDTIVFPVLGYLPYSLSASIACCLRQITMSVSVKLLMLVFTAPLHLSSIPMWTSPLFIWQDKFDLFQSLYLNVVPQASTALAINYMIYFGSQMVGTIAAETAAKKQCGWLLHACLLPPSRSTAVGTVNGANATTVIGAWLAAYLNNGLNSSTISKYRYADTTDRPAF